MDGTPEQLLQKIQFTFHLKSSKFDSDLKHSDKENIYVAIDTLHMIHYAVKLIYK